MRESVFFPLSKKGDLVECGNNIDTYQPYEPYHRDYPQIIMRRIRNKLLPEISEEQFRFKKDCGNRDAIFVLRILAKRSIEI